MTEETYRQWRIQRDANGLVWLCIDVADAATNVLSREVMAELAEIVESLRASPPSALILWSGKPGGFIAGADVREFPELRSEDDAYGLARAGQTVFQAIADLPCRTVAVINGTALGGGLELAMACDQRLLFDGQARVAGLPEVMLGVNPGFGGTVRAPALVGVRRGLEMILTGKSLRPHEALSCGLVDRLTSEQTWRDDALELVNRLFETRRVAFVDWLLALPVARHLLAIVLRRQVRKRANPTHYPAPYAIIDLWRTHGARGPAAYDAEARSLARLIKTDASRNLVRVFFLQTRLKGLGRDSNSPLEHIHLVGAGTMGGDIAAWCAMRGLVVTLQDRDEKQVQTALERADTLFGKRIRSAHDRSAARARLRADVEGSGVAAADIVLEAIYENLDAKRDIFAVIEPRLKPGAILASNTSSIPLEQIAEVLADSSRLVGIHFFNPVAMLPLVEVVRARETSAATVSAALAFCTRIGKLPLPCASSPGFLVNRVLAPYMSEALELMREGHSVATIDAAAVSFGMPVGPIELADSVGLDVVLHVAQILGAVSGRAAATELVQAVADGHLGRKSGQGFYRWKKGRKIKAGAANAAASGDIQDRLMLPLINEAARCLADGIVDDSDLVDAAVIFGTGFAPFRGGPLQYARDRGIDAVVAGLEALARVHGDRFEPAAAGWSRLRE